MLFFFKHWCIRVITIKTPGVSTLQPWLFILGGSTVHRNGVNRVFWYTTQWSVALGILNCIHVLDIHTILDYIFGISLDTISDPIVYTYI